METQLENQITTINLTLESDVFKARYVDNKLHLPPKGNTDAKLMIIVSHPNKDDLSARELLTGDYGVEVDKAFKACGLTEADVYITAMVKHGIGAKPKPTSEQIEANAAVLDAEIAFVNYDVRSRGLQTFNEEECQAR
jgi:uracil-DNA glycosylase family 4